MSQQEYLLPVGMTEFNAFADRIIEKSGNFADRDSMVYAIAMELIHADPKTAFNDEFFVTRLRKVASNQIASQAVQDIKAKQEAARQAAQEANNQVEVTTSEVVTDEQTKEN